MGGLGRLYKVGLSLQLLKGECWEGGSGRAFGSNSEVKAFSFEWFTLVLGAIAC